MFTQIKSSFVKLKNALFKTKNALGEKLKILLGKSLDAKTLEEIEKTLFEADLGSVLVEEFITEIKKIAKRFPNAAPEVLLHHLETFAKSILEKPPAITSHLPLSDEPFVILLVGANGSGKTTTAAKLAKHYQNQNKNILLVAGDTFRAAAQEQLETWAGRLGLDIAIGPAKADPSAVIYEGLQKALAKGYSHVIADTAGRLESKTDLMHELAKVKRVCQKVISTAPHEIFLVLDATIGQTAIEQAKTFHQFTSLTGIILTKLDGTAKGGIALAIYKEMGIPIRYIGLGEGVDDFLPFDNESYVGSLFTK